jgi:hypothetical protein
MTQEYREMKSEQDLAIFSRIDSNLIVYRKLGFGHLAFNVSEITPFIVQPNNYTDIALDFIAGRKILGVHWRMETARAPPLDCAKNLLAQIKKTHKYDAVYFSSGMQGFSWPRFPG